jgi:nitrogen regulatory protein P-II 2
MKTRFKKVTIVAERVLHDQLIELLKRHHVSGWTVQSVTGEGSRGNRASEWEGSNVQIYTLVSEANADAIMEDIAKHYFQDWSVAVYSQDVDVLRSEKYQDS